MLKALKINSKDSEVTNRKTNSSVCFLKDLGLAYVFALIQRLSVSSTNVPHSSAL